MKKQTQEQVERESRKIEINVRRIGDIYQSPEQYFIAHAPTNRCLHRWNDGAIYYAILEGEQEVINFILKRNMGKYITHRTKQWEEEYQNKELSPELKKALIHEVFLGEHYDRLKHFIVRKETSTHVIDRVPFDNIFNYRHESKNAQTKCQKLLDEGAIPMSCTLDKMEHYRKLVEDARRKYGEEWFKQPPHSTLMEIDSKIFDLNNKARSSIDKLINHL